MGKQITYRFDNESTVTGGRSASGEVGAEGLGSEVDGGRVGKT